MPWGSTIDIPDFVGKDPWEQSLINLDWGPAGMPSWTGATSSGGTMGQGGGGGGGQVGGPAQTGSQQTVGQQIGANTGMQKGSGIGGRAMAGSGTYEIPVGSTFGSSQKPGKGGETGGGYQGPGPAAPLAPGPVSGNTPLNPMQGESYDAAKGYAASLMDSTNGMVQRELGRYRDEISVGMGKEGEAAIGRGADPSLFRTRALQQGQRGMNDLQAKLTDVSLGRQAEAIGLQTGAANAGASEQRLMHLGTMSQGLAEQRALMEQQEAQARLNQAPYDRLMGMMQSMGGFGGSFGGSGGGMGLMSGSGGGGGGKLGPASNISGSGSGWGVSSKSKYGG